MIDNGDGIELVETQRQSEQQSYKNSELAGRAEQE